MDPNLTFTSDRIKSRLARISANPKDYDLRLRWRSRSSFLMINGKDFTNCLDSQQRLIRTSQKGSDVAPISAMCSAIWLLVQRDEITLFLTLIDTARRSNYISAKDARTG